MSFVDGRFIRQRMDAKDQRMARELAQRVRTHAEGRRAIELIRNPMPEIRAQGMHAWDDGLSLFDNRYNAATQPIEWANWEAGWLDRHQQNT